MSFYFDHNASTPIDPAVLEVYVEELSVNYANPSSIHQPGQFARQRIEESRRKLANFVGCSAKEIVFVSGGTEADNLAIFNAAAGHVITSGIEHPAVLNACSRLPDVTYLRVGESGVVDPDDVRRAIRSDTTLISIMHVNNEIGTVQPIEEIAVIAREEGVVMHCDGVQAMGRVPVNVAELGVDLYSMSAHKMYGPKGVGTLFVRKGVELRPMLFGGRHESGRRAGTENVPGAVAMAASCNLDFETTRIAVLRDRLEATILSTIPDSRVNGSPSHRAPNVTNIRFDGIEGEAIVIALDLRGFCVSSGAACSSGAVEPSHVLTAIGLSKADARSCIRFSLGKGNTIEQVDALAIELQSVVTHLRRLSPAYA